MISYSFDLSTSDPRPIYLGSEIFLSFINEKEVSILINESNC